MAIRHCIWVGLLVLSAASAASAQSVVLAEEIVPGQAFQIDIKLTVEGRLKVEREGKLEAVALKARATHSILELVEAAEAKGGVGMTLRHYTAATSESEIGSDRTKRELPTDRRLIVAKRSAEGTLHFSPEGPLSRDELELVAEHFDTLCVPALLAGKEVKVGDTWAIPSEVAQHACLFEGIIKNELVGKLVDVKDGVAAFSIEGKAEGIEYGANAKLTVIAKGKFDVTSKRIVELTWEQYDDRAQGAASPATEVKAVVSLKRSLLSERPKELSDAVRAKLPAEGKGSELHMSLRFQDSAGRYGFIYPRDWHIVGRTKDHLVLRLLEKGEFTAQATVTNWQKVEAGKHSSPEEFKQALAKLPGWESDGELVEGEVPTDPGRWLYRIAGKGKQDGQAVVQIFYLLAGPNGEQVAVTFVTKPEKVAKLAPKDLMLTNAIDFPVKK